MFGLSHSRPFLLQSFPHNLQEIIIHESFNTWLWTATTLPNVHRHQGDQKVWLMNAQCLKKLPKKYKTTQQFFAKKCNRRLKKVAQVVINRPIWSHCTPFYAKNTSSKSLLNVFSLSLSLSLLIAGPLVWNFLQSLMNLCSKTRRVCDINLQTENILDHLWRRGSLSRSFYMGHLFCLFSVFFKQTLQF